jgi:hypothetical protein
MCPQCCSSALKIASMKGWERLMVFLTDKRLYHCKNCTSEFRAFDRRQTPREGDAIASARAAGLLR